MTETYHMIDTCDPTIACWSEDGETFVVKDPVKFERTIIPQFFKHSKFSSFVRVSELSIDYLSMILRPHVYHNFANESNAHLYEYHQTTAT